MPHDRMCALFSGRVSKADNLADPDGCIQIGAEIHQECYRGDQQRKASSHHNAFRGIAAYITKSIKMNSHGSAPFVLCNSTGSISQR